MTLLKKLEEAKAKLEEIIKEVEAGEGSAEKLEEATEEVKSLQAQINAADEAAKLMKSLGAPAEEKADKEEKKEMARTLGDNFVEHVKNATIDRKFNISVPSFKAATDIQTSPAGIVDFATTFDRNVVTAPQIPLVIRNLFGSETISGSTLTYLVEGAMEGTPAVTAEGAKKAQVHFADPTPKTVTLKKITAFIKESDEYIEDYPFLASAINGRLLYALGLKEQNDLVADLLATSGIQTDSTSWTGTSTQTDIADLILQATADIQDGSGFAADAIVMSPATWYNLRVAKDGEQRYYGGGFFGAQNVPNLWGIPVCVTTAVTNSQIIVGAFKPCGSVVSKGGVAVEATNSNADDFEKNLMTIRSEERLALAVRRPAGFKLLSK